VSCLQLFFGVIMGGKDDRKDDPMKSCTLNGN
jgi:hypothetical protein